jgi:hypothetical protein
MAIKTTIEDPEFSQEMIESGLADALEKTANYIKSLSLSSNDEELILLSCLLISSLSQTDAYKAKKLADFLTEILIPKDFFIFRMESDSELMKTNLSRGRWGLNPDLIKLDH